MNSLARKIGVANPHQFALHFDALTGMNTQSSGKWRSSFNGEKALSTQQLQLLSRIDPEVFERHEMGPANLWQAMWGPLQGLRSIVSTELALWPTLEVLVAEFEGDLLLAEAYHEPLTIAHLAKALGCGDFVKIEIMRDSKYLLPDNNETIRATEILAKEGFVVLPYMYPDLYAARALVDAGAAAVMPLAAPIGSNKGLATKEFLQILIDEIDLPIIVDAGIGKPSEACAAMEMGAAAIMANTALATAGDVPLMASAFRDAIRAGRKAYLSGLGRVLRRGAAASDPLTGFLHD